MSPPVNAILNDLIGQFHRKNYITFSRLNLSELLLLFFVLYDKQNCVMPFTILSDEIGNLVDI